MRAQLSIGQRRWVFTDHRKIYGEVLERDFDNDNNRHCPTAETLDHLKQTGRPELIY
jgi:hypothetical protein